VRNGIDRRRLNVQRLAQNRAFAVAPGKIRDLEQHFDEATARLIQVVQRRVSNLRHQDQLLATRLKRIDLGRLIRHKNEFLEGRRLNLVAGIRNRLEREKARLGIAAGKIDSLSPLAILSRGYSICRNGQGKIVKSCLEVARGDEVTVTLSLGELECLVEKIRRPED
jgi:exodeoxyribonuclease VII large subunit